jgi:flagellar biosynthesis protein FlhG
MIKLIQNKPAVITLCSGKGGVGKSVLAANIAYSMAGESLSTLIWDADLRFPNQHLLLGVEPPVRLNEVYSGKTNVASALFRVMPNLTLLADMPAQGISRSLPQATIVNTYKQILDAGNFDVLIIDTPAGASQELIECCSISDLICVTITDEPTSLLDAYALIKILITTSGADNIAILVNNVIDMDDAEEISCKLNLATNNFLNCKFEMLGFVPYDRCIRQSILRQELFMQICPDTDVAKSIRNIAENIMVKMQVYA